MKRWSVNSSSGGGVKFKVEMSVKAVAAVVVVKRY
jgi:hypothetical protein